jgi:GTP-binding protein
LIGYPNVGKSSFLNEITNAQSRVANYPFTTLEAHLGVYQDLILADLPGLIEGASEGRGLGVRFLRHVERTRILFHFVDVNSESPLEDYKIIRKELGAYNPELLKKQEYVIISKADTVSEERLKEVKKTLTTTKKEILILSVYDLDRMQAAKKLLDTIEREVVAPRAEL